MSFSSKSSVEELMKEMNEVVKELSSDIFSNDDARKKLQSAANRLAGALDTPIDGVRKIIFQAQHLTIARIGIEGGWFDALSAGGTPKTAADLAQATGTEEWLIIRLMRVLTAAGIVDEKSPQTYASTAVTEALTVPKIYHGVKHFADEAMPIWAELPKYFVKNGYQVPTDPATGPFADKFGMIQWNYFKENPTRGQSFNTFMEGQREGRGCWLDVYPADECLQTNLRGNEDTVFLVDVAGGKGHDLRDVRDRIGSKHGRLVLEDLPEVIAHVNDPVGIEPMAYDFFTPQPIKGARAYYFRSILHDWDDQNCRRILANQVAAMVKGYSKLLINDMVVPETRAPFFVAGMDVAMMTLLCGMERTKTQWHDLLQSVGLKIVHIWQVSVDAESIIETELV